MSDEIGTEGGEQAGDSVALSVDDFYPSAEGETSSEPAPAETRQDDTSGQQATGEAPGSLRAMAERLGVSFGDGGPSDDYGVVAYLAERAKELPALRRQAEAAAAYRDFGERVAPRAAEVQAFLQKQAERQPWEAPEWNPEWAKLVERHGPTGLFVSLPGVPPEIGEKTNAYVQWRDEILADPAKAFGPMFDQRMESYLAEREARAAAKQAEQARVMNIVRSNADWLFAKDQSGTIAYDSNGQPQASELGQQYMSLIRELGAAGVRSPVDRDWAARRILEARGAFGQPQVQQPAGRPGQVHGDVQRRSKVQQALDATVQAGEPAPFNQRLRKAMTDAGVDDKQLRAEGAWAPQGWQPSR